MILTEERSEHLLISSYTPGNICMGEKSFDTSLLITPAGQVQTWSVQSLEALTEKECHDLIAYQPELVLIGTGKSHQIPNLDIIYYFTNHQIGVEIMSTEAACRTYNILILEGRNILAALII